MTMRQATVGRGKVPRTASVILGGAGGACSILIVGNDVATRGRGGGGGVLGN